MIFDPNVWPFGFRALAWYSAHCCFLPHLSKRTLSWCKKVRVKQHKKYPDGKKTNQECQTDGIISTNYSQHLCFYSLSSSPLWLGGMANKWS